MNTNEVAIRCGEHAFTRLQKLLPQQDRLLPKIYQNEDQYIIYWESIHWFESSDKREAELVRAFNRAFDYLEECPFDQDGNILPGYDFESIIAEADSDDYQYRSNDSKSIIWPEKKIHLPENLKELSPETGEETNTYMVAFLSGTTPCINLAISKTKERVKKYFLDDLNVAEKDFISVRLAMKMINVLGSRYITFRNILMYFTSNIPGAIGNRIRSFQQKKTHGKKQCPRQ